MDERDLQLLGLLRQNGRISFQKLGDRTGLSGSATKKRIERMTEQNLLHGFGFRLSHQMFGARGRVMAVPRAFRPGDEEGLLTAIEGLPWSRVQAEPERDLNLYVWYHDDEGLEQVREHIAALANYGAGIEPSEVMEYRMRILDPAKTNLLRKEFRLIRTWARHPRAPVKELSEMTGITQKTVTAIMDRLVQADIAQVIPQIQPAWSRGLYLFQVLLFSDDEAELRRGRAIVPDHEVIESIEVPNGLRLWGWTRSFAEVLHIEGDLQRAGLDRIKVVSPLLVRSRVPPRYLDLSWTDYSENFRPA